MEINFYHVDSDAIRKAEKDVNPVDWNKKLNWIDIRVDGRKNVSDYFQKQNKYINMLDCIERPEAHPFSNTFGNTNILNFLISNPSDIYKADYLSVILENNLIITIIPEASDLISEKSISMYSVKKYSSFGVFLFYVLVTKILAKSSINVSNARNRLQALEEILLNDPNDLSSGKLISCERDINQLSDIIEDQYVGFEVLASLNLPNLNKGVGQHLQSIIKGFEPLDKAVIRLEKKAESLRLQFMIIQQEKSTRKINLLTIIQAVFVPLTFIAGVYGMNFVHMPELNWKFGYLLVWSVFIFLAGWLLIYFYKKGWFD